jgi:hypothetical protein
MMNGHSVDDPAHLALSTADVPDLMNHFPCAAMAVASRRVVPKAGI